MRCCSATCASRKIKEEYPQLTAFHYRPFSASLWDVIFDSLNVLINVRFTGVRLAFGASDGASRILPHTAILRISVPGVLVRLSATARFRRIYFLAIFVFTYCFMSSHAFLSRPEIPHSFFGIPVGTIIVSSCRGFAFSDTLSYSMCIACVQMF